MNNIFDINKEHDEDKDIAIIGIGLKLPDAETTDEFWNNLVQAKDFIQQIPSERKRDVDHYFQLLGNKRKDNNYVFGAYLNNIDYFDYSFFNILPKEACIMDPNQRIFLEIVWNAIENAGYSSDKLKGSNTGVFIGYSGDDEYKQMINNLDDRDLQQALTGNLSPCIASRIAYILDFHGPNMLINTLCSSSLVAVHLACKSLQNKECDMAIVGGIQLHILPIRKVKFGIESNHNMVRTFDDEADGTCPGEGAIAYLLKPLRNAQADRDNIYAIIRGSAVNCDGASVGLTAPNPTAQSEVIVSAWESAAINPETISYIEAHGTGTKLGDPIEVEGIMKAFRKYTNKKQFCGVGSVKSNIGHLDAVSGAVGLLKTIMALKNNIIPPTLHLKKPNSIIPFVNSPIYIIDQLKDWKEDRHPKRCGVSSFGLGGTNCHVVLEEYTQHNVNNVNKGILNILTISAKYKEDFQIILKQYLHMLLHHRFISINNVCYTANMGRKHYDLRIALIVQTIDELKRKIILLLRNDLVSDFDLGIYSNIQCNTSLNDAFGIKKIYSKTLRKLQNICILYIQGESIDWEAFYTETSYSRISIPTHPFHKNRAWLKLIDKDISLQTLDNVYHKYQWIIKSVEKSNNSNLTKNTIIIINKEHLTQSFLNSLNQRGRKTYAITVAYHKDFSFTLEYNGYITKCFKDIFQQIDIETVDEILYFLSMDRGKLEDENSFKLMEVKTIYTFNHLIKAINHVILGNSTLYVFTVNVLNVTGDEVEYNPTGALLHGYCKGIEKEINNIKCKCIDLDRIDSYEEVLHDMDYESTEPLVAYRKKIRYIPILAKSVMDSKGKRIFKKDGVYVIAGGGNLGLKIAEELSKKNQSRIVIISRSKIPKRDEWLPALEIGVGKKIAASIQTALKIISNGSDITFVNADITNYDQCKEAFKQLRKQYGRINGVFHCAAIGVGKKGYSITQETDTYIKDIIAPKVYGLWVIDKITREDNLDFLVVISSLISLTGGTNSGSYIAANTFMNAFVNYRRCQGFQTHSLILAPWKDSIKNEQISFEKFMFTPLTTKQIIEAMHKVLRYNIPELFVGAINTTCATYGFIENLPFQLDDNIRKAIQSNIQSTNNLKDDIVNQRDTLTYSKDEEKKVVTDAFFKHLGFSRIDENESLFNLGGDSITSMSIVQSINVNLGIKLNVKDVVSHPNIVELSKYIKSIRNGSQENGYTALPLRDVLEHYPLSSSQKRYYILHLLTQPCMCNLPDVKIIYGDLEIGKLNKVFQQVINRHQLLRTSIQKINDLPMLKILNDVDFNIVFHDTDGSSIEDEITKFIRPFDLKEAPLFRVEIVKLQEYTYLMMLDMHHIIFDGISKKILFEEFTNIYANRVIEKVKLDYTDYLLWQKERDFNKHREFWLMEFREFTKIYGIPCDFHISNENRYDGNIITIELDLRLVRKLHGMVRELKTTLFSILFSSYSILIARYNRSEEAIIGTITSGRSHPDTQNILGVFVNFIPIRCYPKNNQSVLDFLKIMSDKLRKVFEYEDYPLENIINDLNVLHILDGRELYNTMFIMQNIKHAEFTIPGVKVENYEVKNKLSRLNLTIEAEEINNTIQLKFEYSTNLYRLRSIQKIIKDYITILEQLSEKNILNEIELSDPFIN